MKKISWYDLDEAVSEMADSINNYNDSVILLKQFISEIDTTQINKRQAKEFERALDVAESAHCTHNGLVELTVLLFNHITKGRREEIGKKSGI